MGVLRIFPVAAVTLASAIAQTPSPSPSPQRDSIWRAEMPAGNYLVSLSSITSISRHEFIVDAVARVTEVTVASVGPVVARFYYIEPITPGPANGLGQGVIDKAKGTLEEMTRRAGVADDAWRKVVKNYPTTTHAHTVEYRLDSLEALDKLYASLERSWTSRRGELFKP
jgi:hypothetical protein